MLLGVVFALMARPACAETILNDPTLSISSAPAAVEASTAVISSTPVFQLTFESSSLAIGSITARARVWMASDPGNSMSRFYRIEVLDAAGVVKDEQTLHRFHQYLAESWATTYGDRIRIYLRCKHGPRFNPTYLYEVDTALTLKAGGIYLDKADIDAEAAFRQEILEKQKRERRLQEEEIEERKRKGEQSGR